MRYLKYIIEDIEKFKHGKAPVIKNLPLEGVVVKCQYALWIRTFQHIKDLLTTGSNYIQLNESVNMVVEMLYEDNAKIMQYKVVHFIDILRLKLLIEVENHTYIPLLNTFENQLTQATGISLEHFSQDGFRMKENIIKTLEYLNTK